MNIKDEILKHPEKFESLKIIGENEWVDLGFESYDEIDVLEINYNWGFFYNLFLITIINDDDENFHEIIRRKH